MSDVGQTRPVVSAARSSETRRVGDRERESQRGKTHTFLHGGSWMPPHLPRQEAVDAAR